MEQVIQLERQSVCGYSLQAVNESTISSFRNLPDGWNGQGALSIPESVITIALDVIKQLDKQPLDVFPTGRETIQIEYDIADKSLEIEMGEKDTGFLLASGDSVRVWRSSDIMEVFRAVNDFFTIRSIG